MAYPPKGMTPRLADLLRCGSVEFGSLLRLEPLMSSKFHAKNAATYEQLMGRWSRRLAKPFLEFAGLEAGERVLDVGCGTGSLTFSIPQVADVSRIDAVDYSDVYVEAARQRNADPRIAIARG